METWLNRRFSLCTRYRVNLLLNIPPPAEYIPETVVGGVVRKRSGHFIITTTPERKRSGGRCQAERNAPVSFSGKTGPEREYSGAYRSGFRCCPSLWPTLMEVDLPG